LLLWGNIPKEKISITPWQNSEITENYPTTVLLVREKVGLALNFMKCIVTQQYYKGIVCTKVHPNW